MWWILEFWWQKRSVGIKAGVLGIVESLCNSGWFSDTFYAMRTMFACSFKIYWFDSFISIADHRIRGMSFTTNKRSDYLNPSLVGRLITAHGHESDYLCTQCHKLRWKKSVDFFCPQIKNRQSPFCFVSCSILVRIIWTLCWDFCLPRFPF